MQIGPSLGFSSPRQLGTPMFSDSDLRDLEELGFFREARIRAFLHSFKNVEDDELKKRILHDGLGIVRHLVRRA